MPDLLIELFSEEIPARMQSKAADDLKRMITDGLVEAGLTYAGAAAFSTPRRLALTVQGLTAESPAHREERRGPKVGAPDKAVDGFAKGAGVDRSALEERDEKKGRFYFAVVQTPGRPADGIVAEVLEQVIRGFPWPKSMRWGSGDLRWVRPLHRILCVLSDQQGARVVPLDVGGIVSARTTEGHRFMAPDTFDVTGFDDYEARLKRAHVVLSADERADAIWQDATSQAFAQGLEVVEDKGLLREVAGLVEWPVVLMGAIGEDFLGLPPEVLQTSMKEHQKFFSVNNPKTGRIEKFVTVANIETADHGATILAGNQKVLAARLADAKFFWENDLRVAQGAGLGAWVEKLSTVTFHRKLGSQAERVARIAALAEAIAPQVGADPALARQAAEVAKADLSSEMVYEFPELQGLMGRYYAEAAGLPAEVAAACEEHYSPLGPSDAVPEAPVSVAVALADKIDTLTGFWAIDEKPTGSKDPYALRRAALGVIRLILENGLRIKVLPIIDSHYSSAISVLESQGRIVELQDEYEQHGLEKPAAAKKVELASEWSNKALIYDQDTFYSISSSAEKQKFFEEFWSVRLKWPMPFSKDVNRFLHDRLKVFLRDEGIPHDVIDAVLAMPGSDDLVLVVKRAKALAEFLKTDDGENLLQGFRRANNILTQAEEKDGVEYSFGGDPKFAEVDEERALFAALEAAEAKIDPAMQAEDFGAAMAAMAGLRGAVDAFFEAVQVNAESQILRRNRLNLLSQIRTTCLKVADLTKLEG